MSNKPAATTPIPSTATVAPDYAVPDAQEAWERFDRLVGKVLESPKTQFKVNPPIVKKSDEKREV